MNAFLDWMKGRLLLGAAVILGILTTFIDFTSQILSFVSDGIMQILLITLIAILTRKGRKP